LVSFQPVPATPAHLWLGAESCAASGCHGDARPGALPWQNAFLTWLSRDPHAQAYEVLWTFRGREMTRLLSTRTDGKAQQPLSDNDHLQVLKDRCLGCHATPGAIPATANSERYLLGVTCESCHGAAGHWLRLHDCQPFARTVEGFIDTKDLSARAAVCVQCHVGPSLAMGVPHPVDHDLIAAGHPRLNFDFYTYFESLPPHWNPAQDHQRHATDFHFASWLAGEKGKQVQRERFWEASKKMNRNGLPDFALLDCGSCHHSISAANQKRSDSAFNGSFPFELSPNPGALSLNTFSSELALQPGARLAFARTIVSSLNTSDHAPLYDEALQTLLTVRAITADFSPPAQTTATNKMSALRTSLDSVGQYLASECFAGGAATPTQYDWPTNYQPAKFMERTKPLIEALQQFEADLQPIAR
jgi:hypothetical protein